MSLAEVPPSPSASTTPALTHVGAEQAPEEARWGLGRRIAFRFAFAYLVLYSLPFPVGELPWTESLRERYYELWDVIVPWVGARALDLDVMRLPSGSSDTMFDYVQLLTFALVAVTVTLVWSVADRRRPGYARLQAGLRVYVRYFLATAMLSYGLAKVFKTQFGFPSLEQLTQPLGEASPMGLVWRFMGYSKGYNLFTGGAEVLGAVLLCFRRTTTLGALVVVAVMSNVVALNFFYDVPVKLLSSHLLLMAGLLLLPDLRRLADFFVFNRAVAPVVLRTPFSAPWMERASRGVKVLFVGWFVYSMTTSAMELRATYGDAAPRSPLHGIYKVESFAWNGQEVPPLVTDATRWKTVVFSGTQSVKLTMMDDSVKRYRVSLRPEEMGLTLSPRDEPEAPMLFDYAQAGADSLVLEGRFGDDTLRIQLAREDDSRLLLLHRGFHWINEQPFNR